MKPSRSVTALRVTALTALVAVLTACSAGAHPSPAGSPGGAPSVSPPPLGPIPVLSSDVSGRTLPIEAYLLTPRQFRQLQAAEDILVSRCVARYGFSYTPPPATGPTVTQTTHRYDPVDPAVAAAHGYHPVDASPPPGAGTPAMTADLKAVLGSGLGVDGKAAPGAPDSYHGRKLPVGGCRGAAQADLTAHGGTGRDADVAVGVNYGGYQESLSDPRLTAAFRAWSGCMKQKGFSYGSPPDAAKDPHWEKSPRPSAVELATATADAGCKQQTDVVGVWYTVESAYENLAIRQNQARLTAARDADARMIGVANSVLAQGR